MKSSVITLPKYPDYFANPLDPIRLYLFCHIRTQLFLKLLNRSQNCVEPVPREVQISLRKHAYMYSNILRILPLKNEHFQMKTSGSVLISALNVDCGYLLEPPRRGGSNEYPQSMFLNRNKKTNVYPCKPQFYCIEVGFKGVRFLVVFSWWSVWILPVKYGPKFTDKIVP